MDAESIFIDRHTHRERYDLPIDTNTAPEHTDLGVLTKSFDDHVPLCLDVICTLTVAEPTLFESDTVLDIGGRYLLLLIVGVSGLEAIDMIALALKFLAREGDQLLPLIDIVGVVFVGKDMDITTV